MSYANSKHSTKGTKAGMQARRQKKLAARKRRARNKKIYEAKGGVGLLSMLAPDKGGK